MTDVGSGAATVVRDLFVAGNLISSGVVWSEVFARCDDPSVAVRWSNPSAITVENTSSVIERATVNYQSHADGGCANTDSSPTAETDPPGLRQRTNCERLTPRAP